MGEQKTEYDFAKEAGAKLCCVSSGGKDFFVGVNSRGSLYQKDDDSSWKKISCCSSGSHASVGDDGTLWYCQRDGDTFTKDWDDSRWKKVSGKCKEIECGSKEHVACVRDGGGVYLRDGEDWKEIRDEADQVSIGSDGELWAINNMKILRYDHRRRKWKQKPGRANQISVGDAGNILVLKGSQVFSWTGRNWDKCDIGVSRIDCLSTASDGTIALAQKDDDVYIHTENSWIELPGKLKHIATGGDQAVIGINKANELLILNHAKTWGKFPGKVSHADVGDDGELWAVKPDQTLHRWDRGTWDKQPGRAKKVFVGSKECILSLQSDGDLFEWCSNKWKKIGTGYSDAGVGCDGEIWAVEKKTNNVYRRSDDDNDWRKYPGKATHISVGDEDSVLCVRSHKSVYRKEWNGHRRGSNRQWWEKWADGTKFGDSINIGPDGTCVRLASNGTPMILWGEDDPDSSDSDADEEQCDIDGDMEVAVRVSVRVKPPKNYEARRRAAVRRAERSRRRTARAVNEAADEVDDEIDEAIEEIDRTQRAVNREIDRTERAVEREVDRAERKTKKAVKKVDREAQKAAKKAKRAKRKLQKELRKERQISFSIGVSF